MKKLFLTTAFFTLTPFLLIFSLIFLAFLSYQKSGDPAMSKNSTSVAFAALPSGDLFIAGQASAQDIRLERLKNFFSKHDSPLEPYANDFITVSEKYDLDYRLLPAIAMQESNLCKKAPKDTNNCWGFGIYGKKKVAFSDLNEAINIVAKTMAEDYTSKGLKTVEQIMTKYTPSSDGSWAESVNFFMNQL